MLIAVGVAHAACPLVGDGLLGSWHGRDSDEHWVAVGEGIPGVSLEPTFFELLYVTRRDGGAYIARPGARDEVTFPCDVGLTFRNAAHDWPTVIDYARSSRGLSVRVGADGGRWLRRRWRPFKPATVPVEAWTLAPEVRLWWGDEALSPDTLAAARVAVEASFRRGDQVGAVGRLTVGDATRPFSAVWRSTDAGLVLLGLAAWDD